MCRFDYSAAWSNTRICLIFVFIFFLFSKKVHCTERHFIIRPKLPSRYIIWHSMLNILVFSIKGVCRCSTCFTSFILSIFNHFNRKRPICPNEFQWKMRRYTAPVSTVKWPVIILSVCVALCSFWNVCSWNPCTFIAITGLPKPERFTNSKHFPGDSLLCKFYTYLQSTKCCPFHRDNYIDYSCTAIDILRIKKKKCLYSLAVVFYLFFVLVLEFKSMVIFYSYFVLYIE